MAAYPLFFFILFSLFLQIVDLPSWGRGGGLALWGEGGRRGREEEGLNGGSLYISLEMFDAYILHSAALKGGGWWGVGKMRFGRAELLFCLVCLWYPGSFGRDVGGIMELGFAAWRLLAPWCCEL